MNIELRQADIRSNSKLKIVDVDIHPKSSVEDLKPYLSQRWWDHLTTYGARQRQGYLKGFPYPKMQPLASRRDSWPPDGGLPASNLDFMKQQFLDAYPIEYAIMNPLSPTGQGDQNSEFSAAMAYAANEFQLEGWHKQDQRLLASVVVPFEDGDATRVEVKRRAGDKRFAHVLLKTRTNDLLGKKQYWPVYEAAIEAGLPIGIHVFGTSGRPASSTGWPSFYIEDMTEHASCCQAQVASLVLEGVFERYPGAQDRDDRGRLRLDAVARLAHGQELEEAQGRGPAPEEGAVGIYARAYLGLDPADGGDREAGAADRHHEVDRLGQDHVLVRLSALGFRRSVPGAAAVARREDAQHDLLRERARALSALTESRIRMASHVVAAVDEIPPGQRKLVEVGGRNIVVFNLGGDFFALNNRCPHRGGSLAHGIQTALVESKVPGEYLCSRPGEMVKCPWHGWEFDIRTGKSWCDPTRMRMRQYTGDGKPGRELVEGPYVAESFPVRVENNYVVVEA